MSNLLQLHPALVPVQFEDFSSFGTLQIVSLTSLQSLLFRLMPATDGGFPPLLCSRLRGQCTVGSAVDRCWWMLVGTSEVPLCNSFPNRVVRQMAKDDGGTAIRIVLVGWYFNKKTHEKMGKR